MYIYHVLSDKRLSQKIVHAEDNSGELLITSHKSSMDVTRGAIPAYLHCLKYLVGGIPFSINQAVSAIRVKISKHAKWGFYRGSQNDCDFDQYSSFDIVSLIFDDAHLSWQETLLLSTDIVEEWTSDISTLEHEFNYQFDNLLTGTIEANEFFYRDFTVEEQISIARIIGSRLGYKNFINEDIPTLKFAYDEACRRINAL